MTLILEFFKTLRVTYPFSIYRSNCAITRRLGSLLEISDGLAHHAPDAKLVNLNFFVDATNVLK